MAELEAESPSTGLTGYAMYLRAPHDVSTELVQLYFEDLTLVPVTCSKLFSIVRVTFSSAADLRKAAEMTSYTIGDGCILTSLATPIASLTELHALGSSSTANSAVAIEPTQAEAISSTTLADPCNLTNDASEKGSSLVQTGKSIAVVSLDAGCQLHVSQYCMKELQDQVDGLNCTVVPLGAGMLLLDQALGMSDRDSFQQAATRISQYVDKFATLVVAIPDHAANENLRKFLKGPGNAQVSCVFIARSTSGCLYKVTCDKTLLSEVHALLVGAIPILHCSTRAATDSGTHSNSSTGPYVPAEPCGEAGEVGKCRVVVSAHISAMQLFNRHFVTQFNQTVQASAGSLPREALATVACEASGFVVQGSSASVTVAEQLLREFLTRFITEERWLKTDPDNRTQLLQRVAAVEDATSTTIVVLDELLGGADSEGSHQARQIYAATTAADGADRVGGGEYEAGRPLPGRRLQLQLVQGSLAEQTDDVLVNSVGCALRLSQGAISSSILKKAGQSMQKEISGLKPNGITEYDLAVTKGHKLSCKEVFHVACGAYDGQKSEEKFAGLISKCLKLAEQHQMKSIAFPAIGSGILQFPPEKVIAILHAVVSGFSARNLQSVKCVVFDSASHEVFNSTLTRLLEADAGKSSAADIPLGRFQMSVVIGMLATERSNLILHATDKYLTLQDTTSKGIEGAMDKAMEDELQTLRANCPLHTKSLHLKTRLQTGSQLMLLNTSEINSLEQWASVITSALLYADQMKYRSLSVSAVEEGEWNIDKCIPALLETIASYESQRSVIPTLKHVRIVVNSERSQLAAQNHIRKFLEHRSKSFLGTVASRIGKWVLPSAEKDSDAANALSRCVLHIVIGGADKASISDACRKLVHGVQPGFWQWLSAPSNVVPQRNAGSYDARQDLNQHESQLTNALKLTNEGLRQDQQNFEFVEKGSERSRLRQEDEQHAVAVHSENQYSKSSFSSKETRELRREGDGRSPLQGAEKGPESWQLQQHYEPRASKDERALSEGISTVVNDKARVSKNRERDLPERSRVDSNSLDAPGGERLLQGKQHRVMHENEVNRDEKPSSKKPNSEQIGGAAHSEAKQQLQALQRPELSGASALKEYGRKEVDPGSYDHRLDNASEQRRDAFVAHAALPPENRHTEMQAGMVQADKQQLTSVTNMQHPLKSNDAKIPPAADGQIDGSHEFQTQNRYRSDVGVHVERHEQQQHSLQPPQPLDRLPRSSDDQVQPRQLQMPSDSQPSLEREALGNEIEAHQGRRERASKSEPRLDKSDLSQKGVTESENLDSQSQIYAQAGLHEGSRGSLQEHEHKTVDRRDLYKEPQQELNAEFGELRNKQQPNEDQLQQHSNVQQQQRFQYFEEQPPQQQLFERRISREQQELGEHMATGQQDDQQRLIDHSQLSMKRNVSHETLREGVVEIESSENKAAMEINQAQNQLTQLQVEQLTSHRQGLSFQSRQELVGLQFLCKAQKEGQRLSSVQHWKSSASSDGGNQPAALAATELSSDGGQLTHLTKGRAPLPRRGHPYRRPRVAFDDDDDRCTSQASATQRGEALTSTYKLTIKCNNCGEESDFDEDAICCPDCGASFRD